MSEMNSEHNRAVWFDIPVVDLERAACFYRTVLKIEIDISAFNDFRFAILEHGNGNGGCLVPNPGAVRSDSGVLLYLNANGRIRDAVRQVEALGGKVVEPIHAIGPHGFRAVILDSEGNRIALHSTVDA